MTASRTAIGFIAALVVGCATGLTPTTRGRPDEQSSTRSTSSWAPPDCATTSGSFAPAYDLSQLPVFSKTLYYVRQDYLDPRRMIPRRAFLSALDFLEDEAPEVFYEMSSERPPKSIAVRAGDRTCSFPIDSIDAVWTLRSALQSVMRFVQPHLAPRSSQQLLALEIAATNGMLSSLDPHSVLLDAETYGDMRSPHTKRNFAGVGLVFKLDERDRPIVLGTVPDGPADRAGILRGDHLIEVGGHVVEHMNLEEILKRLRGSESSILNVILERAGAQKKFSITRAAISGSSMTSPSRILATPPSGRRPAAKIGYIKLVNFAADASWRVADALTVFQHEQARGIVLDLRDNSGGLYEQAWRVVDAFAKKGVIVSMIGLRGFQKDETAVDDEREPAVPIVVLVNHRSAAASEIVAAALRSLTGAVVLGERTAGAGSIQVLYDIESPLGDRIHPPKLGLKLTTAQWATTGGAQFEGFGLLPDVALSPRRLPTPETIKAGTAMTAPSVGIQELDYKHRLPAAPPPPPSPQHLGTSYLVDRDEDSDQDDEALAQTRSDVFLDMARDILAATQDGPRPSALLEAAKPIVAASAARVDAVVTAALSKAGIDWKLASPVQTDGHADLVLVVGGKSSTKGQRMLELRGTVTNTGSVPLQRAHVTLAGTTSLLDARDLLIGRVEPGKSAMAALEIPLPPGALSQTDTLRGRLDAVPYVRANTVDVFARIEAERRPRLSFKYEVQPASRARVAGATEVSHLLVTVKNSGAGPARDLRIRLSAPSTDEQISIDAGHFRLGELAPAGETTATFIYELGDTERRAPAIADLELSDIVSGESVTEKVLLSNAPAARVITPPVLTVSNPQAVDGVSVPVSGSVDDPKGVTNVWIRVKSAGRTRLMKKVFALSSPGTATHLPFEAQVPLWPGSNLVEVFARDGEGTRATLQRLVLRTVPGR